MIFHGKNHLDLFQNYKHGPIQKDEAIFLYGLVKVTRPSTIVEFGLQDGLSAYNFCLAKDKESFYFGLDIDNICVEKSKNICKNIKNCFFINDNCLNFTHEMIQSRKIDLFFLDCSHIFEINIKCLQKIVPILNNDGIIMVHDTGYYTKRGFESSPESYKKMNQKLRNIIDKFDKISVIKDEQKTVNWFMEKYPEFSVMHFHTENIMRNGMTFLQRKNKLN